VLLVQDDLRRVVLRHAVCAFAEADAVSVAWRVLGRRRFAAKACSHDQSVMHDIAIEYGSGSSRGDANVEMTTSIEDEEVPRRCR
jgi:hypothetical protein